MITGAIGSSRALQYTAIGDAVNTTSRLCNLAKPAQVIVSTATYRKVADEVTAVALPPVRLKGKSEEMRVYSLLWVAQRRLRADRDHQARLTRLQAAAAFLAASTKSCTVLRASPNTITVLGR